MTKRFLIAICFLAGCASVNSTNATRGTIAPGPSGGTSSGSQNSPASMDATRPAFKTFAIYTDRVPRHSHYAPSGYMGDSDLTLSGAYVDTPYGAQGPCVRINYKAEGAKGWAGLYWQDPANNWGDAQGKTGYDLRGAEKLTFWARGENGGERIHEFRVGGIVGQYPDSDVANLSSIKLSREWKKYTIDLRKKDLRHIIGGFAFMVLKAENPGGMTAYLDDIQYEGSAEATAAAVVVSTVPLQGESGRFIDTARRCYFHASGPANAGHPW